VALAAALAGSTAKLAHRASVAFPTLLQILLKAVGRPNPVVLSQGAAKDTRSATGIVSVDENT
jgi:hypothetical protein